MSMSKLQFMRFVQIRRDLANRTGLKAVTIVVCLLIATVGSAEPEGTRMDRTILGASSCSTSGCHGGADEKSFQHAVWSQRDVHSRAYATLTTARSARMAEALGIADAAASTRCTSCHAPVHAVQASLPALVAPDARLAEGVSCVSCHGPGGDWVRSHTRPDFTHADRVAAGMKDLRNLYARANSCVACHQVIDPELVAKGRHPRLIFELDGQTAAEPRHWREGAGYNRGQAWLVGQAVALREMSAVLARGPAEPGEVARWRALVWMLQQVAGPDAIAPRGEEFTRVQTEADALARGSAGAFDPATVPALIRRLAGAGREFADGSVTRVQLAYRAERLVLAFDRLLAAQAVAGRSPEVSARLDRLFAGVQSIPDFAPDEFERDLTAFLKTLP